MLHVLEYIYVDRDIAMNIFAFKITYNILPLYRPKKACEFKIEIKTITLSYMNICIQIFINLYEFRNKNTPPLLISCSKKFGNLIISVFDIHLLFTVIIYFI